MAAAIVSIDYRVLLLAILFLGYYFLDIQNADPFAILLRFSVAKCPLRCHYTNTISSTCAGQRHYHLAKIGIEKMDLYHYVSFIEK